MTTVPHQRTLMAVFRLGNVALKIWACGSPVRSLKTTIERLIHWDKAILEANPSLPYTFSPEDISAIRKLTKEAEDTLFNLQSILLRPVDPTQDQGKAPDPNPPKDAEGTNDKSEHVDPKHKNNDKTEKRTHRC